MITDLEARKLASEWHGGQRTALYALTSTGAILNGVNFDPIEDPGLFDTLVLNTVAEIEDVIKELSPKDAGNPLNEGDRAAARERSIQKRELRLLLAYVIHHGPRGPVDGWSKLTW